MPEPAQLLVDQGRSALRHGDGPGARRAFATAFLEDPSAEVLEGLGQAAYLMLDLDESLTRWQDAYTAFRTVGNGAAASRVARNVAYLHGSYAGDWAVASGWLARAQRLSATEPSSEPGWVALTAGMFEPDRVRKDVLFGQALDVGRSWDDADLMFSAMAYLGASLVHADRTEEGMLRLDEAMAAVVGGEVEHQVVIEEIFCQLFSACEHAHDLSRAEQWMRVGEDLARRRNLPSVAAYCQTHYGGLLTAAGRWPEAEAALTEGVRLWALGKRTLRVGALARLAELRVRQGRYDEARGLLDGLDAGGDCARPMAALLLATGRAPEARELVERSLAGIAPGLTEALPLLALLVDVAFSEGDVAAAQDALARMEAPSEGRGGLWHDATVALARGRVTLAVGGADPRPALRAALDGFTRAQYPLESARSRLELAAASVDDRPEVALAEARAAYDAFERLRAARHVDAAAALLRRLGVKVASAPADGGLLTRREVEVLALLGEGLGNPEIATRLFISRKTLEHHVGNVLAKLGLRTRGEAAAHSAREKQAAR